MTADAATAVEPDAERQRITPAPSATQEIVVLDYGGQYSQLIARRVRDCGVFSELLPHHVPIEEIAARQPRGIILSGGPASVYAEGAPTLDQRLLELGVPVMGICYGMQLLVHTLGGRVEQADVGEFGRSELHVTEPGVLLEGLPREQTCWMSHRDTVYEPPPGLHGARLLERPRRSPRSRSTERGIYGIQFHPEVVHTPYGQEILTRFLTDVCGCEPNWSAASIVEEQVRRIREQVGEGKVDLRALRRRGLLGRRAARAPRGRRSADVRVRGPRADAKGRGRAGHQHLPRHLQGPAGGGRRRDALPRQARAA